MPEIKTIDSVRKGRIRQRIIRFESEPGFTISEETYLRFGLSTGQELNESEQHEIVTEDGVAIARGAAIRLLNTRMRSRAELYQRLLKKDFQADTVERVLDGLTGAGLVNDERFARAWVNDRLRLRPSGLILLRRELKKRGIAESIIAQILSEHNEDDEIERAWLLLSRRRAQFEGLDYQTSRRRMSGYLARRGFNGHTMYTVVSRLLDDMKE
ncbi:MAG: regulatory protein RecX [Candidatus Latescibacteria bacterium]|nr:regulatory protein RecX [Candidatus Latescibacterota bacterium]